MIIVAGCGHQIYTNYLNPKVGHSIDAIIAQWGPPSKIEGQAYTWRQRETINYRGYWGTKTQVSNLYDKKGNFIGTAETEVQHYYEPSSETKRCTTTFYVDGNKNVTSFEFKDADCVWFYEKRNNK